ncbi:MAG: hypothetical protein M0R74_11495 [Dehalococcoidia bacterium]|nr:hypothetical protein [Dehalococcoidia bacterium]
MRAAGYRVFEVLAWGAACWGATESVLRMVTGETDALAGAGWLTLGGVAVVVIAGTRRRALLLAEDLARIEDASDR